MDYVLNKMLKPGYKSLYNLVAGWVVFENKKEETDLKSGDTGKENSSNSQQFKLNNFTVILLDKRKEEYPISIAMETVIYT